MANTVCRTCGKGPAPERGGVTVYRENAPGEMPAIWSCREHRSEGRGQEVQDIVDVLETATRTEDTTDDR